MKNKYEVRYSRAKMGYCVYETINPTSVMKIAGPYREESDAIKEMERIIEKNNE